MVLQKNKNNQKRGAIALIAVLAMLKFTFSFLGTHLQIPNTVNFSLMTSILNTTNITSLTNTARKNNDIPVITRSRLLKEAAQKKAEDMLENEYFAHTNPSGKTPWDFIDETGYKYMYAGENLAIHFDSAESVLDGWMISPGHRKNILNEKYTEMGIGIAHGTFQSVKTIVVVQMFAQPLKPFFISPRKTSTLSSTTSQNDLLFARVKGASIEKTIEELEAQNLAQWSPQAKTSDVFAGPTETVSASGLLKSLYLYIALSAVALFTFRFISKRYYRDRMMSAEFALVILSILLLINT